MRFLCCILFFMLVACAPQASIMQVEVKDTPGEHIAVDNKQIAVFAIAGAGYGDSLRIERAATALAEKFEQDRGCTDPLPVFLLSELDFYKNDSGSYDKEVIRTLMYNSGADMQIFLHSLKFGNYSVSSVADYLSDYGHRMVHIPYLASVDVYDAIADSLIYKATVRDSIYMSLVSEVSIKDYTALVNSKLPEISAIAGETIATLLTEQWSTQERMFINFPGDSKWERGISLANDFKWKEAIGQWMPLVKDPNSRKAAYAAYNIAVACEMMGQMQLAGEWIDYSVKKFSFDDNLKFKEYIKKK